MSSPRPLLLALLALILATGALSAADTGPTNVPDPYGLGERLALIDDLHNRAVTVPDNADLDTLRALYRTSLAGNPDDAAHREALARRLWVDYHQTAPADATTDQLTALLDAADKQQKAADAAEKARQISDAVDAEDRLAHPAGVGPAAAPPRLPAPEHPTAAAPPPAPPDDDHDSPVGLGQPFPAITGTSVRGHPVNLADFKGRVVLVDFWATWCGPCVGEMPNVIATYNRYHGQGFDIIGISLDRDHDALTGFLDHNQVTWDILFDSGGWQNAWAQQFHIHSIPNTFLIGKDGRLIAHGLRGPALAPAVAAALGIAP